MCHSNYFSSRNGNPLQYSCVENPMDGGAWWATVHGVAKSWTQLSDFTSLKVRWCFSCCFPFFFFFFPCCLISVRFGEESRFLSWFLFILWEGWSLITSLHLVFSGKAEWGWYLLLSGRDEVLDPHAHFSDLTIARWEWKFSSCHLAFVDEGGLRAQFFL